MLRIGMSKVVVLLEWVRLVSNLGMGREMMRGRIALRRIVTMVTIVLATTELTQLSWRKHLKEINVSVIFNLDTSC